MVHREDVGDRARARCTRRGAQPWRGRCRPQWRSVWQIDKWAALEDGPVPDGAALYRGNRSRSGGFGGDCAAGAGYHTQSSMGDRLPAGFWGWNDRGHDPDYRCHCRADYLRAQAFAESEFELSVCFRGNQSGIWTFSRVPHRVRKRIVYGPSAVDAALIGK